MHHTSAPTGVKMFRVSGTWHLHLSHAGCGCTRRVAAWSTRLCQPDNWPSPLAAARCSEAKTGWTQRKRWDRLDTKEKVRQAGPKGKGETGKGEIHRLQQDVPRQRQAGHKGKGETGWTQRKRWDRLDTKEKVRQAGPKGKGETGWTQRKRWDRLDTKEKVRQAGHKGKGETGWTQRKRWDRKRWNSVAAARCLEVNTGWMQNKRWDRLDTKEKVRQGKVKFTGCSKMFGGKYRLDTKEKVR